MQVQLCLNMITTTCCFPALKTDLLPAAPPSLQADRVGSGKCLFFVRVNPKGVSEKSIESDIAAGEIQGSVLDTFKALVADLYLPVLQEQGSWGKMAADHTQEFLAGKVQQQQLLHMDVQHCTRHRAPKQLPSLPCRRHDSQSGPCTARLSRR
jgi:hypothetical protein